MCRFEIEATRSENELLRSEVANLREQLQRFHFHEQQLQRCEGHHEALTLTMPTPTPMVDLSCFDTSLVIQIASFIGTSLELLNLALTCKSFGLPQPASGLNWMSLAEEAARQAVCSVQNHRTIRISLPQYDRGTASWMSILAAAERYQRGFHFPFPKEGTVFNTAKEMMEFLLPSLFDYGKHAKKDWIVQWCREMRRRGAITRQTMSTF